MKKYEVFYSYDEQDKKYVAVCPKFFGFMIYSETMKEIEKSVIQCLQIYTKDLSIDGKNIELIKQQELELTM